MRRRLLTILAVAVGVPAVILLALPFLIDANRFKPTLETALSVALGRDVRVANLGLAVPSGGLTMDDVSIADDPAFSRSPFLKAKRLTARVALIPWIVSGRLHVRSLTVIDTDISVPKLKISNGTVELGMVGAGGKTRTYQNVTLDESNPSYSSQFPFSLTAKTAGNGTLKVSGHAGPIEPQRHPADASQRRC